MPEYKGSLKDQMNDSMLDQLGYERGGVSKKTNKEVAKSLELLEHYMSVRNEWAEKFREAELFRNGAQWTKKQASDLVRKGQNPIVVNRIHPAIETAKAILTSNKPQFRATAREDSDRKVAKVFSDLFQWVWEISNGNTELKKSIDDYYVGGMGVIQVYQDPHADMGKGEVFLKSLYPLDVYIDPNSRDSYCRDAAHILVSRLMTDEESKKIYPEFWGTISKAETSEHVRYPGTNLEATENQIMVGDKSKDSLHHVKREFIERYTRIKINMNHVFDPTSGYEAVYDDEEMDQYRNEPAAIVQKASGEVNYVTDEDGVSELGQIAEQTGGVFHYAQGPQGQPVMQPGEEQEGSIPGSTTFISIISKSKMIDEELIYANVVKQDRIKVVVSVGSRLLYTRVLPCEDYPVVPFMNIHNRNPFPESDTRIYKPLQEYINKIRSLIVAHASTSTNVKLLIPRGSVNKKEIEEEWGRAGTAVIEFDAELGTPVVAGPIPLPNELYKNEAEAKHDLEYGFGIYELMQGSSQAAPPTYRGTVAIDEYGQRRIKSKQDDVESAIDQIARSAIPLMQQIYTEEKVVRLVQPSGLTTETSVNQPVYDQYSGEIMGKINDITTGKYDIVVATGSTLPSNRWAQFEYYMQLYSAKAIDQTELLKKTEVVDVEGVLQRVSYISQLEGALEKAQEEVKNLKGDLQTSDRETVHAKKRLEVEKFKSGLDEQSSKAKFATELYRLRLNDLEDTLQGVVKPQASETR